MRMFVAGGLLVLAVAGAGGVVLAQKGVLPLPPVLAEANSRLTHLIEGRTAAPPAASVPAPPPVVAKAPVDPVATVPVTESAPSSPPVAGTPTKVAAAVPTLVTAAPSPPPPPPEPAPKCDNPNALGVSRVVQIDTTGGPGFGFEHFKTHDFLRPKEVVLTFDDGPWPNNTPAVLAALAAECVRATFFPIGEHSVWHPEILKQVAAAGHTIGTHTWSHKDLSKLSTEDAKTEIEKGVSAVHWALGGPSASFVRFPALRHPPEIVAYVGQRNMAIFSTDLDSFDFKTKKPDMVIKNVMGRLDKLGKGIILMHDFQHSTALALPELLRQLKAKGYSVVHMKSKAPLPTLQAYDDEIAKQLGGPGMSASESERPTKDIVQTIGGD